MIRKTVLLSAIGLLLLLMTNLATYTFALPTEPPVPKPPRDSSEVIHCNMTEVTATRDRDPFLKLLPPKCSDLPSNKQAGQLLDRDDHNLWGTGIVQDYWYSGYPNFDLWGVFAKQSIRGDIELGQGGVDRVLYAPTLKCPLPCPLEAVTYYVQRSDSQITIEGFVVWDHSLEPEGWCTPVYYLSNLRNDGYTYGSGSGEYYYVCLWWDESFSTWGVYLWNFRLGYWVEQCETSEWDNDGYLDGWNAYETYGWDGTWTETPRIEGNLMMVYVYDYFYGRFLWEYSYYWTTYVRDQFPNFYFSHGWVNNEYYYHWYVGTD